MVILSPLVCVIYFTFLKIYQNKTVTNSANTVKLRNLFDFASNLEKYFLVCLSCHSTFQEVQIDCKLDNQSSPIYVSVRGH